MAYDGGTDPTLAELITRKFVPEIFSAEVLQIVKSNLVATNAFTHRFAPKLKKGHKVSIPVMSEPSASDVTPGTEPTMQDAAGTAVSITVDNWKECTVGVSDLIEIEEEANYLTEAQKTAAYAILKAVDTSVGALFSSLNSGSVKGADGQTFTDAIFRALVEALDEADIPDEGRFLIGDPSMKSDLLNIDKYGSRDFVKDSTPTSNGRIGELYGATVLITNNLTAATTGNYGVYAHPDALGVVLQMPPRSKVWDLGYKFETKIICDTAWGVDELRDSFGYSFYTRKS